MDSFNYWEEINAIAAAVNQVYRRIDKDVIDKFKMTEEEGKKSFDEFIKAREVGKNIRFSALGRVDWDKEYGRGDKEMVEL